MTSRNLLNKFITENYDEIISMSRKIVGSGRHHITNSDEVAHYAIERFYDNPKAEGLIERGEALKYFSGVIHLSWKSSTSPFHKQWRQSGRVIGFEADHITHIEQEPIEEYDTEKDELIEMVETLLEEMEGDNIDRWYKSVLFRMYIDCQNYSELERRTGIPRTSISLAVRECREYIKNKLNK